MANDEYESIRSPKCILDGYYYNIITHTNHFLYESIQLLRSHLGWRERGRGVMSIRMFTNDFF